MKPVGNIGYRWLDMDYMRILIFFFFWQLITYSFVMKGNSLLLASRAGSFAFLFEEVVMSHQALDFTLS